MSVVVAASACCCSSVCMLLCMCVLTNECLRVCEWLLLLLRVVVVDGCGVCPSFCVSACVRYTQTSCHC